MSKQIAHAASALQGQRTGHVPRAVTVVQSDGTLVIALYEALTPAETALAATTEGAAKVQDFHRQLFTSSNASLRDTIKRITGLKVRESAAEIDPNTGAVVHAFTTGTMVQVFLLSKVEPARMRRGSGSGNQFLTMEIPPCSC